MASKNKNVFVCSQCGFESAKWVGKCPGCGEWNTMQEEIKEPVSVSAKSAPGSGHALSHPLPIREIDTAEEFR